MNALQDVFNLFSLSKPGKHFRFGEYCAGCADLDWTFRAECCGSQLIQWNIERAGSRPQESASPSGAFVVHAKVHDFTGCRTRIAFVSCPPISRTVRVPGNMSTAPRP